MNIETHIEAFRLELTVQNYCKATIKNYCSCIRILLLKFQDRKSPKEISLHDLKVYIQSFTNYSTHKANANAIRTYYSLMWGQRMKAEMLPLPRKELHLPKVIDHEVLVTKIMAVKNLKHRAILALAYSCGLRVSEVVNLKMDDIDRARMVIRLRQAKGKKDGEVKMSANLLAILEEYYRKEFDKPRVWLFEGWEHKQYSVASCQAIVRKYIGTKFHNLRHSCITHLIETGVDISIASKIARHSSIKTTMIYNHVSRKSLDKIQMPI